MGLRLASGAGSPRRTASPELALGTAPRSRLWPALAGALLGSGFVIVKTGAPWATTFAVVVGGLSILLAVVAGLVRRTLRVEGSELVLEHTVLGLRRRSGTLAHEGGLWVGPVPLPPHRRHARHRAASVRIVGERGRLTWRVRGSSAAVRELELLREFLPRAGIEPLGDDVALAGSIEKNHNAERTLLSWRAALPTTGRAGALALALCLLALVGLSSVRGQSPLVADAELLLLSLTAAALAIVAVRSRSARATIDVGDQGWGLSRAGLLRTRRLAGGRALLPGRVVGLHGPLPIENSLSLVDGTTRVLDAAELSPPEMRWLVARVVDRLTRDHHPEPRRHRARLVI